MTLCKEERLMEAVELSPEHRDFQRAAAALAERIRAESQRHKYDLQSALSLVDGGNLTVHNTYSGEPDGFIGLPAEVGLFLTGHACGGLFPQAPR